MSYTMQSGRTANTVPVTIFGPASRPSTVNGAAVEVGDRGTARLLLDVTVGTGTLDVAIQTSFDGVTWRSVAAFAQATGVTSERKSFSGLDRFVRAVATIGTGPFTFSVTGEAV